MRRPLVLAVLALALQTGSADAADYYAASGAGASDCSEPTPCDLGTAITAADATAEPDRVRVVGALAWSSPVDLSQSPIELIGSGRGNTELHVDSGVAATVGPESAVRDLDAYSGDREAFVLDAGATLTGIGASTHYHAFTTITVRAGSATTTIRGATVSSPLGSALTTNAPLQLSDSTLAGYPAVYARSAPAPTRIVHCRLSGQRGVQVSRTDLDLESSTIITNRTEAIAVYVDGDYKDQPQRVVNVRGSTITNTGDQGDYGVAAYGGVSDTEGARVNVSDTIVRGYDADIAPGPDRGGGPGRIAVDHSDFHTTYTGYDDEGANVDLDPRWISPELGNYGLAADSPLIDVGGFGPLTSDESSTDLAGLDRRLDGNSDGVEARDIGAFEYQPPHASFTATPETAVVGQAVSFDSSASTYAHGDPTRWEWDFDGDGSFEIDQGRPTMTHVYKKPGTYAVGLRVTAPDGGRGRATRTVTVRSPADTTAPLVRFGPGMLELSRSRTAKVKLTCPAAEPEPCAGTLRLETAMRGRKLASRHFRIAAGKTVTLKVKLAKSKLKLIAKRRVKRVRAIATPRDRAGNSKPYKHVYRLKRVEPKR